MNKYITCIYQLALSSDNFYEFKLLVQDIVSAASKEPDTIEYVYSFDEAGQSGLIIEKYRASEDIVSHVDETFAPFGEKFLKLVDIIGLTVVGDVSEEAKSRLNAFNPVYLTEFDGFRK